MITRDQFKQIVKNWDTTSDFSVPTSPLWDPESDMSEVARWFVSVRPLHFTRNSKREYWDWCNRYLSGELRCFCSDKDREWWGFTEQKDIVVWVLKWA